MKKFLATLMTLVCVIGCMFALASCGDEQAESVALNKTELTLEVGENETLTATVSPETAVDKTVTWESSAPEIASVDGGKVTAKAAGTATITAKTSNDKSATCTVTVKLTLTEQTDFASLKSDKVTETQWKATFSVQSFENCTINMKNVTQGYNHYMMRQLEGMVGKIMIYSPDFKDQIEYVEILENIAYDYGMQGGQMIRIKVSGDLLKGLDWMIKNSTGMIPDFGEFYAQFVYDEQIGAYTYHGDGLEANDMGQDSTGTYTNIAVKIVDGKIAYISCSLLGYETEPYELFVYDYGKTTVTLPTDFTVAE